LKRKTKPWEHFTITFLILLLSAIVGFIFPSIISAFGILGGSCAVMLVIFYPGFCFYNLLFFKVCYLWGYPKNLGIIGEN